MGNKKNYEPYILCCFKCLKNNVLKNRRKMGVLCCMNTAEI